MEYVVCPDDGVRLKAVSVDPDPEAGLVVRCPDCAKVFAIELTDDGGRTLTPISESS